MTSDQAKQLDSFTCSDCSSLDNDGKRPHNRSSASALVNGKVRPHFKYCSSFWIYHFWPVCGCGYENGQMLILNLSENNHNDFYPIIVLFLGIVRNHLPKSFVIHCIEISLFYFQIDILLSVAGMSNFWHVTSNKSVMIDLNSSFLPLNSLTV